MPARSDDEVVVGVVGKPVGVSGAVYVRPDPDIAHDFPPGTRYDVGDRMLEVADCADHGRRTLVRFVGIDDREAAERVRGSVLRVDRGAVAVEEDTWWAGDVVGAPVVDERGQAVGVVESLADGPAHDYLVVRLADAPPASDASTRSRQVLVPAVAELVRNEADHVVVTDVPGLLDPDEAG